MFLMALVRCNKRSSSLLCDGLKELELLAEYRWKDDWNDDALDNTFEAGTEVQSHGNLDVRLLSLLYWNHCKSGDDILNCVYVMLD